MGAKRVDDLVVFQLANELRRRIHEITATETIRADRRFCDQIRDAASSSTRNVAEGFGRYGHREFAQFLSIARGSVFELQDQLRDGVSREYWKASDVDDLHALCNRTIAAITHLIRYLKTHKDR